MIEPKLIESDLYAPPLRTNRDCYNGSCYDSLWDRHYRCGGCTSCPPATLAARAVGIFVWGMAHHESHRALREGTAGLRALEAVGRAVASALSPGLGFALMLACAVAEWQQVRKGRWYRVTGKRGNAKQHHGKVGQVAWLGEIERRSQYGTWSYGSTTRVGLRVAGEEKLVYVSAPSLEPVAEPDAARAMREAAEAMKEEKKVRDSVRPTFPAALVARSRRGRVKRAGTVGCIVAGPHAGKRGEVFWMGDRGKGLRAGVRISEEPEVVVWVDARDVVPASGEARAYLSTIEDAAGVKVSPAEQVEGYVIALISAGFEAEGASWVAALSR